MLCANDKLFNYIDKIPKVKENDLWGGVGFIVMLQFVKTL